MDPEGGSLLLIAGIDLLGDLGLTLGPPRERGWLWAGALLVAAAMAVSVCRRMLGSFSRKTLLEKVDETERRKLEELLPRIDQYRSILRALDQALRLCLAGCFGFGLISRSADTSDLAGDLLNFAVFLGVLLLVVVVFLELVPSILSRLEPERSLRSLLPLLDRVHRVLAPLGRGYRWLVRAGARAVGAVEERTGASLAEEEILSAVEEGEREGILEEGEISMIESIIRFRDREVSEVMTPRTEMVCIDIQESMEESVRTAIDCGHSRIPVYRENKDNIAGILYVKDLLKFWDRRGVEPVRLSDTIRQAHFVPESKKISELFHEFRSQRFHIAIILDEFGGTAGLITIEDIIEEIVGEIVDEFEKEERPEFQRLGPDLVEVDGRLSIHELNAQLEVDLPEDDGYETVAGFLFSALGKIPKVGTSFEYGQVRFEVIEADERKINRMRIRVIGSLPAGPSQEAAGAKEAGGRE